MDSSHRLFATHFALAVCICVPSFAAPLVSVGTQVATVDSLISIPVAVSAVSDLYAYQFDISYTPGILRLESITEGSFLSTAGATTFLPGAIDDALGVATLTANTLVGLIPGATGGGTLALLHFRSLSPGFSPLSISNLTLLDSELNDITYETADGFVAVVPEPAMQPLVLAGLVFIGAMLVTRSRWEVIGHHRRGPSHRL